MELSKSNRISRVFTDWDDSAILQQEYESNENERTDLKKKRQSGMAVVEKKDANKKVFFFRPVDSVWQMKKVGLSEDFKSIQNAVELPLSASEEKKADIKKGKEELISSREIATNSPIMKRGSHKTVLKDIGKSKKQITKIYEPIKKVKKDLKKSRHSKSLGRMGGVLVMKKMNRSNSLEKLEDRIILKVKFPSTKFAQLERVGVKSVMLSKELTWSEALRKVEEALRRDKFDVSLEGWHLQVSMHFWQSSSPLANKFRQMWGKNPFFKSEEKLSRYLEFLNSPELVCTLSFFLLMPY